jgi:hypothetical protein
VGFDEFAFVRTAVGRSFARKGSRKASAYFDRKPFIAIEESTLAMCAILIGDGFAGGGSSGHCEIAKKQEALSESGPLVRPPDEPTPAPSLSTNPKYADSPEPKRQGHRHDFHHAIPLVRQ